MLLLASPQKEQNVMTTVYFTTMAASRVLTSIALHLFIAGIQRGEVLARINSTESRKIVSDR